MAASTLFGGKVEIRALQQVQNPAERTEVLARLATPGGELAVLTDGTPPIRHLSYVELRQGAVRGNHFHRKRHERFYLIAGEAVLLLRDMAGGGRAAVTLRAGDLALIPPEVGHAFEPLSAGHALEFAPEPFDGADVFRIEPLQERQG